MRLHPYRTADGSVAGVVVTFAEITHQKATERTLRALEAALLDADRRKDEFLAVLSHELRNPLAPIKSALALLEQIDAGGGGQKAGRACARDHRASGRAHGAAR
jgi:two-component system CheB/CheR fusion protein